MSGLDERRAGASILLDCRMVVELGRSARGNRASLWLDRQAEDKLYLSSFAIAALTRDLLDIEDRDARLADDTRVWLSKLTAFWGDRILPFDAQAARLWARIERETTAAEDPLRLLECAIAQSRELSIATFEPDLPEAFGIRTIEPRIDGNAAARAHSSIALDRPPGADGEPPIAETRLLH